MGRWKTPLKARSAGSRVYERSLRGRNFDGRSLATIRVSTPPSEPTPCSTQHEVVLSSEPGGCRAFLCKALPCGFSPRQNCRQACPLVVVIVSLRSARVCPLAVAVVRDRGLRSPVASSLPPASPSSSPIWPGFPSRRPEAVTPSVIRDRDAVSERWFRSGRARDSPRHKADRTGDRRELLDPTAVSPRGRGKRPQDHLHGSRSRATLTHPRPSDTLRASESFGTFHYLR